MSSVIWLTGISGSGKTTIANKLKDKLDAEGLRVEVLDGDFIREFFDHDLGYSRQERIYNVKRIALAAMLLAKNGSTVIVANIAPYYEVRDFIRKKIPNYVQVYLKSSIDTCMKRDVKGHYAKARQGKMKDMVGLDDSYDVPRNPHLTLDTDNSTVDECVNQLINYLTLNKIFIPRIHRKEFQVIVTVGPATLKKDVLKRIYEVGPCIFRINGAHSSPLDMKEKVHFIKGVISQAQIMLDLPGNKIRLAGLKEPIKLKKGELLDIHSDQINYSDFYKIVKPADMVFAQDSTLMLEVVAIKNKTIELLSHSNGLLEDKRGLHVKKICDDLPFLFEKDIKLIDAGCKLGITYLGISYVRTADDIIKVKKEIDKINVSKPTLIAKIETAKALDNLEKIFEQVSNILVDRGDLSSEVGLQNLPLCQEKVINAAKKAGKNIFLATQFLKNMQTHPIPLIAESLDLYRTLTSGICGIQLSEETAVGHYPFECVEYVFKAFRNTHNPLPTQNFTDS
jgi:pyruvate kinase